MPEAKKNTTKLRREKKAVGKSEASCFYKSKKSYMANACEYTFEQQIGANSVWKTLFGIDWSDR